MTRTDGDRKTARDCLGLFEGSKVGITQMQTIDRIADALAEERQQFLELADDLRAEADHRDGWPSASGLREAAERIRKLAHARNGRP